MSICIRLAIMMGCGGMTSSIYIPLALMVGCREMTSSICIQLTLMVGCGSMTSSVPLRLRTIATYSGDTMGGLFIRTELIILITILQKLSRSRSLKSSGYEGQRPHATMINLAMYSPYPNVRSPSYARSPLSTKGILQIGILNSLRYIHLDVNYIWSISLSLHKLNLHTPCLKRQKQLH